MTGTGFKMGACVPYVGDQKNFLAEAKWGD